MAAVMILELMTEMMPVAMSPVVVTADPVDPTTARGGGAACASPSAARTSPSSTVPAETVTSVEYAKQILQLFFKKISYLMGY